MPVCTASCNEYWAPVRVSWNHSFATAAADCDDTRHVWLSSHLISGFRRLQEIPLFEYSETIDLFAPQMLNVEAKANIIGRNLKLSYEAHHRSQGQYLESASTSRVARVYQNRSKITFRPEFFRNSSHAAFFAAKFKENGEIFDLQRLCCFCRVQMSNERKQLQTWRDLDVLSFSPLRANSFR